ncbi:MAG: DUF1552 domain-containing protein [Acidobacteria bacterium]|nr:DUF1552 domain-containing protein [Acidobacteriota bacterium]
MNIVMKALPRRTVLRGLGVTLGLPLLDAMVPAFSVVAKAVTKPVHRFQALYVPNGMAMEFWTPATEGKTFELTPILEPLAPFRDQVLVLSGLKASWSQVHAGASGSFLTGTVRGGRSEMELLASTSIDQMLARQFERETQLVSLEVAMEREGTAGQCSAGLSCAYTQTISWRTPTQPLPMESNPRAVFERLFGDSGSAAPAARLARMRQSKSILDSVMDKLGDLVREVGPQDRRKIQEYTEAIRDVERRIQLAEAQRDAEVGSIDEPSGAPLDFDEHIKLMFDLQLLALQSDLTRVVTFMLGKEQSTRTYPQAGVPEAHHPLSHHNNQLDRIALMSKINTYHVRMFAEYLGKLRATPDGDGSLLDHMTILYGAGLSNSTRHLSDNLPLVVVGGGAGRLKGGKHLKYPADTSHANLLVSILDKFDMPIESIGNSTGKLEFDTLSGV